MTAEEDDAFVHRWSSSFAGEDGIVRGRRAAGAAGGRRGEEAEAASTTSPPDPTPPLVVYADDSGLKSTELRWHRSRRSRGEVSPAAWLPLLDAIVGRVRLKKLTVLLESRK